MPFACQNEAGTEDIQPHSDDEQTSSRQERSRLTPAFFHVDCAITLQRLHAAFVIETADQFA